ncbi:serine/threonine-protein kinase DCLK1-like [Octopus vulgaris]|uniref:Serine/threonine-protein kinase DCLK1-like n=1 Tax=Octopus vulgaris TaxID=6645 RepID=A0AA36HIQ5_OCTVU|nr:serine/threonine-protein kinase DCLK1-like [Octopus vulgaris]
MQEERVARKSQQKFCYYLLAGRFAHNHIASLRTIPLTTRPYKHLDICGELRMVGPCVSDFPSLLVGSGVFVCNRCKTTLVRCLRNPYLCGPDILSEKGPSNNQEELFDKILSGHFEFISPFWDEVSSSAKDLIEHMLQVDPEMRFSAAEVLDHPWVANDTAKDNKLHVAKELNQYFTRTKKPKDGLAVIAVSEKFFK